MVKNLINILKNNRNLIKNNMVKFKNILNTDINWLKYYSINKNIYNKNIIYKDKDFELVLITWLPNQSTKLHKHPQNGCLMKILSGSLYEIKFKDNNIIGFSDHYKNSISYIDNEYGEHKIKNKTDNITISLHLYSPSDFYKTI